MDFEDKVVLITGSCSGIGAAIATEFSKRGAQLSMTGLGQKGPVPGLWITADLTQPDQIEKVFYKTIERYGRLDILINCAGVYEENSVQLSSLDQLNRIMSVNLNAAYYLTSIATQALIETSGCIVNISSLTGQKIFSDIAAYSISKAALDHLTRITALELAPKRVRVNSVNPGIVNTEILLKAGHSKQEMKSFFEICKKTHPLGRIGQPDEIAKAVAFLASKDASFITGVCLSVDGGKHLKTD